MLTVADIADFLDQFAPRSLAEDWDNVGLLVGTGGAVVERVMTCLTITPATAQEAIRKQASLIVSHHPLPFKPLKVITGDTVTGRLLLDLIHAGVAVYSPHTGFDSASQGINRRLAEGLGLEDVEPLVPTADDPHLGSGRWGRVPGEVTLEDLAALACTFLGVDRVQIVGNRNTLIESLGIVCGSGGGLLDVAIERGCKCLLTGEARFHTCLDAEARGVSLILAGHYATERFAVESLADVMASRYPQLKAVWAARDERDPLDWLDTNRAA